MDILLVAGLWLDASAWDAVVPRLRELGHRPSAISLPGQGAPPPRATLQDQHDVLVAAVDEATSAAGDPVMVVGHSAASSLAWMAADARPQSVARAVMIGGFPANDGEAYAGSFPLVHDAVPFPGWDLFEGPDAADLDESARAAISASAIPVPRDVATGIVRLSDERRWDVPVTLVCPEFTPAQAREWIDAGLAEELAHARDVDLVDIDSGHWPMFTRPTELADLLGGLAGAWGGRRA